MRKPFLLSFLLLCLVSTPALAKDFSLKNYRLERVTEVYIVPTVVTGWGENLLTAPLTAGGHALLKVPTLQGECAYRLRFVFASGEDKVVEGENLCHNTGYVLEHY